MCEAGKGGVGCLNLSADRQARIYRILEQGEFAGWHFNEHSVNSLILKILIQKKTRGIKVERFPGIWKVKINILFLV